MDFLISGEPQPYLSFVTNATCLLFVRKQSGQIASPADDTNTYHGKAMQIAVYDFWHMSWIKESSE